MAVANKKGPQISFEIPGELKIEFDALVPRFGAGKAKGIMTNLVSALVAGDVYVTGIARGEVPTMTPKPFRRDVLRVDEHLQKYVASLLNTYKTVKDWEDFHAALRQLGVRLEEVPK